MKTYKIKNYKGNIVESLKKFSDSFKGVKIVHAYVDEDSNLKIKAEKIVNESFDDKHPKTAYTVRNNTRTFSHSDQPKEYGTYRTEEDAEKMRQWLARKDPSWRLENTEVVPKELDPMLPIHWTNMDGIEESENINEALSDSVFAVMVHDDDKFKTIIGIGSSEKEAQKIIDNAKGWEHDKGDMKIVKLDLDREIDYSLYGLDFSESKSVVKEDGDSDIDWCINGAKIAVIDRIVWQAGNFFEDHPDATKEMIAQEVVDELKYDDGLLEKVRILYYYLKQKTNQNNL